MLTKDNNVIEEDAGGRLKASDVCWRCDFAARPDDSKQWEYVCCNPDSDADYVQYNDCCEKFKASRTCEECLWCDLECVKEGSPHFGEPPYLHGNRPCKYWEIDKHWEEVKKEWSSTSPAK